MLTPDLLDHTLDDDQVPTERSTRRRTSPENVVAAAISATRKQIEDSSLKLKVRARLREDAAARAL